MKSIISLAVGALIGTTASAKDMCYALAMAGGGTKGAYEAGAMWGIINAAKDLSKYAYDVVTGVSAGSINGGAVATFAPGDEANMVKVISDTWQTLSTDQIFRMWKPLGLV